MDLYCCVTKEELIDDAVTVDLLVDGGTADVVANIFCVNTWDKLYRTYGNDAFERIFIDGGIYGSFTSLDEKEQIMCVMRALCKTSIILYGHHMLLRGDVARVELVDDPLRRKIPCTRIPVEVYTMKNIKDIFDKKQIDTVSYQRMRWQLDFYQKF